MGVKTGFGDRPGVPVINRQTCVSCGRCAEVCGGQPLYIADGAVQMDMNSAFGCLGCGLCMLICPTESITVTGRNLSPEDLLELPPPAERATPEALEALLLARRSMRKFAPRPVAEALIERVLRVASTAPMGLPPSDVHVLLFHGREEVRALSDETISLYEGMLKFFRPWVLKLFRPLLGKVAYGYMRSFVIPLGKLYVEKRRQGEDALLYDAPAALLFHASPYADPADSTIAATYAMLAAESLGLATCMIGAASPMLARSRKARGKHGIPRGNKLGLVLLIGYPGFNYRRALRRRFASVKWASRRDAASQGPQPA